MSSSPPSSLLAPLESAYSSLLGTKAANVPPCDPAWLLASFVFHWILFFVLPAGPWIPTEAEHAASGSKKPLNRRDESLKIRNGLVSTIHALVGVVGVLAWLTQYEFEPFNVHRNMAGGVLTPGNANGDAWLPMLTSYTVGYFAYDTLCMFAYRRQLGNVGSYIHHLAIGIAMGLGLITGIGRFYHFIYLVEELSTPALNMKNLYRHRPRAYKFWSLAFVVSFVVSRGVVGLTGAVTTYYCLTNYWIDNHVAMNSWLFTAQILLQGLSFTCSRVLNIYWMSLIAKYLRKARKEAKDTKQVKSQ